MFGDRALFSDLSLEGEFTDWTYQWTRNFGAGVNLIAVHVDNFGTIYLTTITWASYVLDRANGLTLNAGAMFDDTWGQLSQRRGSITNKYMIDVDTPTQTIFRVWRYGAIIETIDVTLINVDFNAIWHIAISPNGRYIAAEISSVATGNVQYIVLWMAP
ncbi:MAG: hypothetical protein MUP64_16165 [Anaerolineae bacterium]|nr:hypothetical protein [Anaerolineae bacterium]